MRVVQLPLWFLIGSVPAFALGANDEGVRVAGPNLIEQHRVGFRSAGELAFQATPEQPKTDPPPAPASQVRPPAEGGVYRVGGGVTAPAVIYKRDPKYSEEAKKGHLSGTVVLTLVVGPDGLA